MNLKVSILPFRLELLLITILDHFNPSYPAHSSQSFTPSDVQQTSEHQPVNPFSTQDNPPPINYSTYPCPGKKPPTTDLSTHPSPQMPSQDEPSNHPEKKAAENRKDECVSGEEEYDLLDIAQAEYDSYLRRLIRMEKRVENRPRAAVEYPDASIEMAHINLQRAARVLEMVKDYTIALENERYDLEIMRKWGY
jgi:hypothetical protein